MGRINLYDVIQPHYTTFCEAVEPKSFIIHLPRLTPSDRVSMQSEPQLATCSDYPYFSRDKVVIKF